MKSNIELIKVALPYFKKYRHILLIDLICAALTTIAAFALPLILSELTVHGTAGTLTTNIIWTLALIYLVLKIVEVIGRFFMINIGHRMGARIETDMRSDIYNHLMKLSDSYYNENKVGQLMSRVTNDLADITEFSHHAPEEYFIFTIQTVVSLIILGNINLPLTIIVFLLLPVMFFISKRFRSTMQIEQMRQRQQIGNLNAGIEDSLSGMRVVRSFANEEVEVDKFEVGNQNFLNIKAAFYRAMASFNTITLIFEGLMYIAVLVIGGYFILNDTMQASDMIVFIMYINMLITSMRRIIQFTEQFQKGMTGIQRFDEVMTSESDIENSDKPIELTDVKGNITFSHVDFSYTAEDEMVLKDLNIEIKAGEKVAFVGPSGAGKSTIINLIPRFYDVDSGTITIDGHDIRDLSLETLRDNIGIVQQDVYLFSGTVEDNIRYGKIDATEADVRHAAELASATEFIEDLPKGFQTDIGEKGARLSGGQKQRISIARVFLKNPPILILDEATSALDNQSEMNIQESLEELARGRTTVTIAHRLTTIEDSDLIYVLSESGVIEQGSHGDLMNKQGYYYHLYTRQ